MARSRRRALGVAIAVLTVSLGFYYYYLDHSVYIATASSTVGNFEGDYIAVFAGDPHLNAFGFPHLRDTTDLPALALPNGSVIAAAFGTDIYGKLSAHLSDEWNAVMAGWKGDSHEAERLIKLEDDHIDLTEDPPGLKLAVDILGEIDAKRYQRVLEQNAPPVAPGRAAAALQHIASVDPQRALDLYSDGMEGITELQLSLLQGLSGDCLDDAREVLDQLAQLEQIRGCGLGKSKP